MKNIWSSCARILPSRLPGKFTNEPIRIYFWYCNCQWKMKFLFKIKLLRNNAEQKTKLVTDISVKRVFNLCLNKSMYLGFLICCSTKILISVYDKNKTNKSIFPNEGKQEVFSVKNSFAIVMNISLLIWFCSGYMFVVAFIRLRSFLLKTCSVSNYKAMLYLN